MRNLHLSKIIHGRGIRLIFYFSATRDAFGMNPRYADHRALKLEPDGGGITNASGKHTHILLVRKGAPPGALAQG